MLDMLVSLLVLVLVAGVVFWLIGALALPQPWARAAQIIIVLIFLLILIGWMFGGVALPPLRWGR